MYFQHCDLEPCLRVVSMISRRTRLSRARRVRNMATVWGWSWARKDANYDEPLGLERIQNALKHGILH